LAARIAIIPMTSSAQGKIRNGRGRELISPPRWGTLPTNGGFVPNVYDRYGDIIVLYVLAAPSPGYAEGRQLGASDVRESPVVGSRAPWHVSLSISPSVGLPARCVVAAQPTHDGQFAP
jgi:hypothetical protein